MREEESLNHHPKFSSQQARTADRRDARDEQAKDKAQGDLETERERLSLEWLMLLRL